MTVVNEHMSDMMRHRRCRHHHHQVSDVSH